MTIANKILKKIAKLNFILLPYYILKIKITHFTNLEEMINQVIKKNKGKFYFIRSNQHKEEIYNLLSLVKSQNPKTLMEIGTAQGGTLFMLSQVSDNYAKIISIDIPNPLKDGKGGYPKWRTYLYKSFAKKYQNIHLLRKDSHKEHTLKKAQQILHNEKLDFLFIDGDHSYEGVKKDFEMYSPLVKENGIIAFHDIVPGPYYNVGGVPKFWEEIKLQFEYKEFVNDWNQERYGIGVIFNR